MRIFRSDRPRQYVASEELETALLPAGGPAGKDPRFAMARALTGGPGMEDRKRSTVLGIGEEAFRGFILPPLCRRLASPRWMRMTCFNDQHEFGINEMSMKFSFLWC